MNEKCKVPAFEYFQKKPDWYNFMQVSFNGALDSINKNFKNILDAQKGKVIVELKQLKFDIESFDDYYNKVTLSITKLNTSSSLVVKANSARGWRIFMFALFLADLPNSIIFRKASTLPINNKSIFDSSLFG